MQRIVWGFWTGLVALGLGGCTPQNTANDLSPEEAMVYQTLRSQLTDPSRTAETRYEAARLLLGKPYQQADETLESVLSDPSNNAARIAAAEAIATDGTDQTEFVPPLMDMLVEPDPAVRSAAARALVTYPDQGVLEKLLAVARDRQREQDVRLEVIEALRRVVGRRSVEALVDLLSDPSPAIRTAAADSLSSLTNIRSFGSNPGLWRRWWDANRGKSRVEWLEDLTDRLSRSKSVMEKDNARLRERLVRSMEDLYNTTPPEQRPLIVLQLLGDPVSDLRLLGVDLTDRMVAANEPIPPEVRQRVLVMLNDKDPRVRQKAATLSAILGGDDLADRLLSRLRNEPLAEVRVGLFRALGHLRSIEALPVMIEAVLAGGNEEAAAAAGALGRISDEPGLDPEQQSETAAALVRRYQQAARSQKDTQALREALLGAMGSVGHPREEEVLEAALNDPAGVIRLAAVAGLAKLGATESAPAIRPLLADDDRGVRQAAIAALGTLGTEKYLAEILQRTDPAVETDPAVRKQAWDQALSICRSASPAVLAEAIDATNASSNANAQRAELLGMFVEALRAEESPKLREALLTLGETLLADGRAREAVPVFTEAYTTLDADDPADAPLRQSVWKQYVHALLEANDPAVVTVMTHPPAKELLPPAWKAFRERLEQLRDNQQYLPLISLIEAVRNAPKAVASYDLDTTGLAAMLAEARRNLRDADRQTIAKLLPQLRSTDAAGRSEAEEQIKSMGDRAVRPLLLELRKSLLTEPPDPQTEQAIYEMLRQVATKLGEYDTEAERPQRLQRVETWLESY